MTQRRQAWKVIVIIQCRDRGRAQARINFKSNPKIEHRIRMIPPFQLAIPILTPET
jgi:hypothetical protein